MKIRRSYSVDGDVYEKFLDYAKDNSLNISQFIQNAMMTKIGMEKKSAERKRKEAAGVVLNE